MACDTKNSYFIKIFVKYFGIERILDEYIFICFELISINYEFELMEKIYNYILDNIQYLLIEIKLYKILGNILLTHHNIDAAYKIIELFPQLNLSINNDIYITKLLYKYKKYNEANPNKDKCLKCIRKMVELYPKRYNIIEDSNKNNINIVFNKKIKILLSKQIDKLKKCSICYMYFSDLITNCNHQYCINCFDTLYRLTGGVYLDIKCSICRRQKLKIYNIKNKEILINKLNEKRLQLIEEIKKKKLTKNNKNLNSDKQKIQQFLFLERKKRKLENQKKDIINEKKIIEEQLFDDDDIKLNFLPNKKRKLNLNN